MKKVIKTLVAVCLCTMLLVLSGCSKGTEQTAGEVEKGYWVKQGVTMECGKEFDMAILEIEGNQLDQKHYYQRLYEKDIQELNLPYNPQLDVYLNLMIDEIAKETTTNMEDIVLASASGVCEGKIWYFLVETYTDKTTGNKIIDILGLHDEGTTNLVVLDVGIEDKVENIPRGVIEDFIDIYNLNWTYDDLM